MVQLFGRCVRHGETVLQPDTAQLISRGAGPESWSRLGSWLRAFRRFLHARAGGPVSRYTLRQQVANNALALDFLAKVAREGKGTTRPARAARALNFLRLSLGMKSLNSDPRTALLRRAVCRDTPHVPKGARPIPPFMTTAIAEVWGSAYEWWKVMVALLMLAAFQSLLRAAGILSVPQRGTTWIVDSLQLVNPSILPVVHDGVMLMVPRRKTRQSTPSWVVLRAGRVTELLQRHLTFVRATVPTNHFLFPARLARFRRQARTWVPHPENPLSAQSFRFLVRRALQEVCSLTREQADQFSTHSLRVAGINYLHSIGVSTSMRAQVADHASVESSLRYLRLTPLQQLQRLNSFVRR